ncbi:MAG TPA: hypothetical protein VNU93_03475 [Verrucomicrobiae bacterium]|nr:hypothetical protein [Verrucomicrobiae bacterium]
MLIRYICECCDRLVEEVMVSEERVNLLDDDAPSILTDLSPEDIMSVESNGSLLLDTICPECLSEIRLEQGGALGLNPQTIN